MGWAEQRRRRRRTDGTAEIKLGTDLFSRGIGNGILDGRTHIQRSLDDREVYRSECEVGQGMKKREGNCEVVEEVVV